VSVTPNNEEDEWFWFTEEEDEDEENCRVEDSIEKQTREELYTTAIFLDKSRLYRGSNKEYVV